MLTKDESVQFLTKVLGIEDPLTAFERDKHALLDSVVSLIQEKIPFQGITLMAKLLTERRKPTLDEVKTTMMQGKGGICYDFNMFTNFLLKSLGYDVHLNICQVVFNGRLFDNHLINLVTNLRKEGDMYLVDTGCARPTFRAIDLGFSKESLLFCDSFTRYKFVKEGHRIRRYHDCLSAELNRDYINPKDSRPTVGRFIGRSSADKMSDFSSFFIGRQKINYNYLVIIFFPSADSFGVLAIGR